MISCLQLVVDAARYVCTMYDSSKQFKNLNESKQFKCTIKKLILLSSDTQVLYSFPAQ